MKAREREWVQIWKEAWGSMAGCVCEEGWWWQHVCSFGVEPIPSTESSSERAFLRIPALLIHSHQLQEKRQILDGTCLLAGSTRYVVCIFVLPPLDTFLRVTNERYTCHWCTISTFMPRVMFTINCYPLPFWAQYNLLSVSLSSHNASCWYLYYSVWARVAPKLVRQCKLWLRLQMNQLVQLLHSP